MNILIKIIAVSLVFLCISIFIRQYRPEYVFLMRLSAIVIIAYLLLSEANTFFSEINNILSEFSISQAHLILLLKVGLISILSDFIIDLLKDSGDNSLAGLVAVSSKLVIISMSFPIIKGIMIICRDLIK